MNPAILVVDCDLGFVFWLGQILDRAGYEAFPARSVPDALKLITELHLSVSLMIVDYSLSGAANLIATMRRAQKSLKIMALVEDDSGPTPPEADAQYRKPRKINEVPTEAEMLHIIRRLLSKREAMGLA
jgi:DNA-binding NtrC family response regulator